MIYAGEKVTVRAPRSHGKTSLMDLAIEAQRAWALHRLREWHRRVFGERTPQ